MLLSLQYLRGVAALLVVYFHSLTQLKNAGHENIYLPIIGESGVDLFFVLSGFVMWLTTANRKIGPVDFIVKRIKRIVPIYWILTLAATLLALFFGDLMKSTVFDVPHLVKSLFFIPAYNPAPAIDGIYPVIIPGWTLNFEFFFYLIFGLSLLITKIKIRLLFVSVIILVAFSLSFFVESHIAIVEFYLNDVIIEFLLGVVLGKLFLDKNFEIKGNKKILIGAIFVSFFILLYNDYDTHNYRSISLGFPAFLAIYFILQYENSYKVVKSKVLELLGDASYSIYLTHIFILAGLRVFLTGLGLNIASINVAMFTLTAILSSALLGIGFYLIVEKRCISLLRTK
ncbi:hypothetical protein RJ41_17925 [Alteromonas marina]|uniref:Acyltransferase 3 domain-containing protein n=1 Tax=Alteromonas marina TaxID=203795 RepID=A0A0B3XJN1_9ALTE|nr:acyltransferase [Alteromonas marina]KHT44117.1 hypothetical protein RJ41_17925 [Alteromonas marina]